MSKEGLEFDDVLNGLLRIRDEYTPEVIDKLGESPSLVAINIFEKEARRVLSDNGYGPDEMYLTPGDQEMDRLEWANEMTYVIREPQLPSRIAAAALVLIEGYEYNRYLELGDAERAAQSMIIISVGVMYCSGAISTDEASSLQAIAKKMDADRKVRKRHVDKLNTPFRESERICISALEKELCGCGETFTWEQILSHMKAVLFRKDARVPNDKTIKKWLKKHAAESGVKIPVSNPQGGRPRKR